MPSHRIVRRLVPALLAAAALLLAACGQVTSGSSGPGGPLPTKQHAKAAAEQVTAEQNQLLDGSPEDFRSRLDDLRGTPVVVNQWASWCGPCRSEFPFFQHLAKHYNGRVAFLGIDSQDSRSDAEAFLKQLPVPYPHYYDEDTSIARSIGAGRGWPTTVFFNAAGKAVYTHIGAYSSEGKLDDDIRRYALDG
jgi:cytochrome c biogenesis protein CcmG/thiol:disulfide interchange protein DsbE